ncbi:Signal transduction regulator (plasmid) [Halanaeroarchaeum sp. HSR-CO]|nr:Signal transduction regulator [Halanaeroarchaeum sp. HSR-CO]
MIEDGELSLEEKQRRVLELVKEYLGVTNGYIQSHSTDSTTDEILVSVGDDPNLFPEGETYDRDTTYCRRTVDERAPIALSNVPEQGWENDPAYVEHEVACYLGTTLFNRGSVYGTICFVQREPRDAEFSPEETMLVELAARLLGRKIEDTQHKKVIAEKKALQTELEKTTKGTLQLASELEQRYQRLFEGAVEGIYKTTEGLGKYRLANAAFADLLGYESGDALCEAIESIKEDVFVNPTRYEEYSETLQKDREIDQFEYQIRTADGERRWVSDSVRVITDEKGAIKGYRGGVVDITEDKQQERALKRQTNLSIVLNRVLRHNLRNKLSVIRGYTQMMADQLGDDPSGLKALNAIDDLIALSEKARDLDEIISNDAEPRPADIPDLIEGVVTQMRRENPSATISIDRKWDEEITAEVRPSFERAIRELVENAVKHSGDEPRVEVTIEPDPDDVQIHITDNGDGLGEQEVKVLQSGSETPLLHGSGLGLWLTHWIVTSQGGYINATASKEGSTLSVSVPRTQSDGDQNQLAEMVRARDRYKSVFKEAGDGMTITDDEGRILAVNNEAARIFRVPQQELIGRSIQEFLPADFDFEDEWGEITASDTKRGELPIASAEGGVRCVEYTTKADVVPGQHLIVSRDVTERNERERELKRMRDYFEEAERLGGLGAWEVDGEGNLRWTAGTRNIHEVDEDFEPTLSAAIEFYHNDDRQQIEEAVNDARTAGKPFDIEARIITATGDIRWVRASGGPIDSEMVRGYIQDITEQKERERQVVEMKERYQSLLKSSPDPVIVADGESGEIIEVSDAAEALFKRSSDEFNGMYQSDLHPPDQAEAYRELFEEHIQSGGTKRRLPDGSPIDIVTADGEHIPVEISSGTVELSDGPVTYGIFRDISDQVERERQIEQERAKFRGVFEDSLDAMVIAGDDGRYIDVNERAIDLFGVPEEELLGQSIADFAPEDFDFAKAWQEFQESEKERGTFPLIRADGDERIVEYAATRDIVPGKNLPILRDITEREERERELVEKTRQLEAIVQNTEEAIYIKDTAGYYQFINDSGADVFDMSVEEIIGKHDEDLFEAESAADIRSEDEKVMESGEAVRKETVRYIEGEKHVFLDAKYPYRDEDGEVIGLIGISPDITDRTEQIRELR